MTRKSEDASRSTIRDVAARARVSASTVSRVLGGVYPVSATTRTRVLRAVREMDYVADARARAIAGVAHPDAGVRAGGHHRPVVRADGTRCGA